MGSKATLLGGDLGRILLREAASAQRFVDLFAGSGAVAIYAAQRASLPVLSVDLQEYARVLSAATIERTTSLEGDVQLGAWVAAAELLGAQSDDLSLLTAERVHAERAEADSEEEGFITRHYGGHYFSLDQARRLDALYAGLPQAEPQRTVALAALLHTASACAAAPGHTAQPFQPTTRLLPYVREAWSRSVTEVTRNAIEQLAPTFAKVGGEARVGDALTTIKTLSDGDLVFCDPPYSAVQYSRFYHVLEGIAVGGWDGVGGRGRAPVRASRKTSEFSMRSKAPAAMKNMLARLRARNCRVVITFPDADASNGLSSQDIMAMAAEDWRVEAHLVDSVHSTLGGSSKGGSRGGRKKLQEAVLVMSPRSIVVDIPATSTARPGLPSRPFGVVAAVG